MKNKSPISYFISSYFDEITHCINSIDGQQIEKVVTMLMNAYKHDKKIFLLGNGGSASTASHFACDLGKGTLQRVYDFSEKRFRIISLTDNVALITAFANDISYEEVFVQQLKNLLTKDDVVMVFSGSGNSKNIIKAVTYAQKTGAKTIGFLGFKTGGKVKKLVDLSIVIDSSHYGPVEDMHVLLTHLISSWVSFKIHTESKKRTKNYKNNIFSHPVQS